MPCPQPCVERLTQIRHNPANLSLGEAAIVSSVCARLDAEADDRAAEAEEINALPAADQTEGQPSFLEFQADAKASSTAPRACSQGAERATVTDLSEAACRSAGVSGTSGHRAAMDQPSDCRL